jgi:uncharacterized protein DUF6518
MTTRPTIEADASSPETKMPRMSAALRLARVLVVAFAFGLLAAWAKGPGGVHALAEIRSALGNLSTPWLLVAFAAGAMRSRLGAAALVGLLATTVALTGFYLLGSLVQDLGGHGFAADLRLELAANRGYLEGGLITGPLFGALGAWWRQRRTLHASALAGVLLMAEPLILLLLGMFGPGHVLGAAQGLPMVVRLVPGWGLSPDSSRIAMAVYAGEFVVGLGVLLLASIRRPRTLRA